MDRHRDLTTACSKSRSGRGDGEDENEDGRGGWCSCNVVIYQPRNEGLMVVICIRVQEGTGMGLGQ